MWFLSSTLTIRRFFNRRSVLIKNNLIALEEMVNDKELTAEVYHRIKGYSPYDNVEATAYPHGVPQKVRRRINRIQVHTVPAIIGQQRY